MSAKSLSILPIVIAGLVPATHSAGAQAFKHTEPWVAGINPAMTTENDVREAA